VQTAKTYYNVDHDLSICAICNIRCSAISEIVTRTLTATRTVDGGTKNLHLGVYSPGVNCPSVMIQGRSMVYGVCGRSSIHRRWSGLQTLFDTAETITTLWKFHEFQPFIVHQSVRRRGAVSDIYGRKAPGYHVWRHHCILLLLLLSLLLLH